MEIFLRRKNNVGNADRKTPRVSHGVARFHGQHLGFHGEHLSVLVLRRETSPKLDLRARPGRRVLGLPILLQSAVSPGKTCTGVESDQDTKLFFQEDCVCNYQMTQGPSRMSRNLLGEERAWRTQREAGLAFLVFVRILS